MGLYRYVDLARKLFEEEPPIGTSILAVLGPGGGLLGLGDGGLKVALILKEGSLQPNPPFDAHPWWTPLNEVRIVAEVTTGKYFPGGESLNSTGDFVGGLLQGVLGEKDRLIFTTRIQSEPPTKTHAYRWSEFAPKESSKRISDGDLELVEVSVTDADYAAMKTIMNSPAILVPLKHGTHPVEFRPDERGRLTSQIAASA